MNLKALVTGAFLTLLAAGASAQKLELGRATFGGAGCANGTARATLTPDGQAISILFDNFTTAAGGYTGLTVDQRYCDIAIPVRVPQGYSVAVFTIDYRGFAALPSGGRMRFSADYFFAGKNSRRYSKEFLGPYNDNYTFTNELRADLDVWSACGAEVILRTQSMMATETNRRNEDAMASVDSIDIQSGITYNFQYRRCGSNPNPPPPVPPTPNPPPAPPTPPVPPAPPAGGPIHGYIDGFQDLGAQGLVLNGWACAKNRNESIDVHVYVNGAAGTGQFVKAARADRPSEPAVAQQCQTQYSNHRFSIPFTRSEAMQLSGVSVFVHGISPVGLPNLTIGQSGRVSFPVVQANNVRGGITSVEPDGASGNWVTGYACIPGQPRSLDIEVFIGGPAGSGTFAGTGKADMNLGDNVSTSRGCNPNAAYRVNMGFHVVQPRIGLPVYAYAVDPSSGTLIPLDGSGRHYVVLDTTGR